MPAASWWRLVRADRMEAEALESRSHEGANAGLALIRDGNGTRATETLMSYRSAAMTEFARALRTLKALQAEQAQGQPAGIDPATGSRAGKPDPRILGPAMTARSLRFAPLQPNEPEKARDGNELASGKAPPRAPAPVRGAPGAPCPEP